MSTKSIVILIVVLLGLAGIGYYLFTKQQEKAGVSTEEVAPGTTQEGQPPVEEYPAPSDESGKIEEPADEGNSAEQPSSPDEDVEEYPDES
ncbi:MAG: hypothetical protein HY390_06595 [Deltaproteobacteria bacterium]|nr:hypothetical protein [Deltaproteobacteria bacterium]